MTDRPIDGLPWRQNAANEAFVGHQQGQRIVTYELTFAVSHAPDQDEAFTEKLTKETRLQFGDSLLGIGRVDPIPKDADGNA